MAPAAVGIFMIITSPCSKFPALPTARSLAIILLFAVAPLPLASAETVVTELKTVEVVRGLSVHPYYTGNRSPLLPSPFFKLSIGSIKPQGWLRHQLQLEADGMTGHLEEISKWCKLDNSAWATRDGSGQFGWEELPYWLKGYGDLGYVLGDEKIIRSARKWIDAMLASQRADGFFGPEANKTSLEGKPDLWPHMVMCNVLESFYEYSKDERVIPFLTAYFKWLNSLPPESFGLGYWPKLRFGDNIQSVYWLYNHTGDAWLLDLSRKIHENMARWDTGVIDWHNVNISQGFREPGVYFQQSADRKHLDAAERNYQTVLGIYGQFPGGGFGGDENCRPGYVDPRQGFETCGITEFMHSFEMLTKISGDPRWADRCEELAFNSLPAALTPDLKGLHYLTSANQVQLDKENKAPGIQNGGTMFSYSPGEVYRCCQHNVSHGWPYYAEELWLATADRGLCASLYAASEVSAKVAEGATVRITETTGYPFSDTIMFKLAMDQPASFPFYFRIPSWCNSGSIKINGKSQKLVPEPSTYAFIDRVWKTGDTIELKLPMEVSVRKWVKNQDSVSVDYGPLAFSLKIGERWSKYGKSEAWPEWEVFPTTPWNYALVLDAKNPAKSFKVTHAPAVPAQPFTPDSTPIQIQAKARKVPQWQQDKLGLVGKLQPSPVKTSEPIETITLIPMGAARLRITSFPVAGSGPDAHEWTASSASKPLPVSASYVNSSDSLEALVDGSEPKSSNDQTIPRFTWWDHRGTTEWVQFKFAKIQRTSGVEVYWFDDTGAGACRVPKSWRLLYLDGDNWKPVEPEGEFGTQPNCFNRLKFRPVESAALRIEAQLQPEFSSGILEWKVSPEVAPTAR
jgi:hypothetical protein